MGDVDPCFSGGDGFLPVLCQTAAAPEPGEGAFDHPSAREDLEALRRVGALDDLQRPVADPVEGAAQFRPGIAAVREDMPEPGTGMTDGFCLLYTSDAADE